MDSKKWEEVINHVTTLARKEGVDVEINFEEIIVCALSTMASVFDYVLNGWVEYKEDICEKLGSAAVSIILLADRFNGFIDFDTVNRLWYENVNKEFTEKRFQHSYIEFCYDLGMLSGSYVETGNVTKEAQFVLVDFIDIVLKFMTQEQFYNLMMGIEGEDEDGNICE